MIQCLSLGGLGLGGGDGLQLRGLEERVWAIQSTFFAMVLNDENPPCWKSTPPDRIRDGGLFYPNAVSKYVATYDIADLFNARHSPQIVHRLCTVKQNISGQFTSRVQTGTTNP
jgi:hypothetical protein